jgi:hypothetical protein
MCTVAPSNAEAFGTEPDGSIALPLADATMER